MVQTSYHFGHMATAHTRPVWPSGSAHSSFSTSLRSHLHHGRRLPPAGLQSCFLTPLQAAWIYTYTVYMHTGTQQHLRRQLAQDIAASLRPASQVLIVSLGDWNFLADATDGHTNATADWYGQTDSAEATAFADLFGRWHHFQELHQSDMTHMLARGTSRLDRVYSSHHLMDQLDREWGCAPLPWVRHMPPPSSECFRTCSSPPDSGGQAY